MDNQIYMYVVSFFRISIRAGNHFNDLTEIEQVELNEPNGWFFIPLKDSKEGPIRTFMIQIAVLSNHQNGRDTHMRQIKVHSPVQDVSVTKNYNFTTTEMGVFTTIRWESYSVDREVWNRIMELLKLYVFSHI